ncbi:hypothetical protein AD946_03355, partial [Gluconobacter thailandicus]
QFKKLIGPEPSTTVAFIERDRFWLLRRAATSRATSGLPGAGYWMLNRGQGREEPKSWMVLGRAIAVTPTPRVSQWAEMERIARGCP